MAALTPGWAFPGFRGTPSIGLVELSISTYSMVSCAASVGTSVVFTATVAPDENGVDRPMRLPVALQSFLRHFPDTATDLTVDVGPRGDDHPDLWTRALWDTVFLARPSFTDLTLAAKTDLEVKKLSAMAFITHAARASARGTAESPLPFYLTWTIDSVLEQRRPGLGEIAEELEVLGEVLTRCPLPEACTLNLLIECTTDNAAFVRCVKALEEGQVETMGESEAEAAVLTQLRRIVHGQEMVEVVVKDTRGGKSESVVLERPDEEDEEDPLL
ncbi:hypothetical protein C8Q76DRAFT_732676 [Earliella scabrosa]|nr:hypothetical protein C8Q76DRAFT_732676 [Earliella scabrosa]